MSTGITNQCLHAGSAAMNANNTAVQNPIPMNMGDHAVDGCERVELANMLRWKGIKFLKVEHGSLQPPKR
jgi:uncharacterized protein YvpB